MRLKRNDTDYVHRRSKETSMSKAKVRSKSSARSRGASKFEPIGVVRNEVKTPVVHGWGRVESDLVFEKRYTEALDGIEEYSHVLVLFWMDRARSPSIFKRPCSASQGAAHSGHICSSRTVPTESHSRKCGCDT